MIQIGISEYPTAARGASARTLYRTEARINQAVDDQLDPACPDCTDEFSDHHRDNQDAGCTVAGCICTLTQQDLEEGNDQ